MRTDSRLPRVLHVLLHLGRLEAPVTSEQLGKILGMNSSLVRRTMAGLREAEFVSAHKGHGGGWLLAIPLDQITVAQVYRALGAPQLFAVGPSNDRPDSDLEQAVNASLRKALSAAQNSFVEELEKTTVADLLNTNGETSPKEVPA